MELAKLAAGSLFISSCLILSGAGKAAQGHPLQPASFSALSAGGSHPKSGLVPGLGAVISTKPWTFSGLAGTFGPTILIHSSLIGTSKVTTTTKATIDQPGSTSVTTVPASLQLATQDITAVIDNDWASWTGSSKSSLTIAEVGALLANGKITGSQAAVLGMIADQMNSDISSNPNVSPSYTQAQALAFVLGTNSSESAVFYTNGGLPALPYFQAAMAQIASSTTSKGTFSLYGSYTGPQLTGIQQAAVGDCFYLSAVDSVLNQNPQLVANMIKQNTNGTFTVSFPGKVTETVTLTDGDIASFSTDTNNGSWLTVMGLAENSVLTGLSKTSSEYAVTSVEKASPLGIISDGGYPTQTLSLLTGNAYSTVLDSSRRDPITVAYLDSLLQADLANKTPIGVESLDHALAIIGFNVTTQTVTILNPWGVSGAYGYYEDPGISNPSMNVEMTNGVFTLTTQQMLQDFYSVTAPTSIVNSIPTGSGGSHHSGIFLDSSLPIPSSGSLADRGGSSFNAVPATLLQSNSALTNSSLLGLNLVQSSLISGTIPANAAGIADSIRSQSLKENADDMVEPLVLNDGLLAVSFAPPTGSPAGNATAADGPAATAADGTPIYEAGQGTLFVMHDSSVQIHTSKAIVQVAAQTAALIVQIGNEVAITNLCDQRMGDVAVLVGDQRITVPQGRTIVLSKAGLQNPESLPMLTQCLDGPALPLQRNDTTNVFLGRASYPWALKNCPQFRELTHSTNPAERKAVMRVLRTGAAVMTVAQDKQS